MELNDTITLMLATLEGRMRQIAAEVVREQAEQSIGGVKVKTAAAMLDMTEWRVRQLIKEGKLPVVRPTPNTIRIPLASIRHFLEVQL